MNRNPPLGIYDWQTPLSGSDLVIIDVRHVSSTGYNDGDQWVEFPQRTDLDDGDLLAHVFAVKTRSIFAVRANTVAFRVQDECGLTEIWSAPTYKAEAMPTYPTFKLAGHGWHGESILSFDISGPGFSYLIATGMACLEIISMAEPTFELVRKIGKT